MISHDGNQPWQQIRDTASDKSLVEGGIVVTQSWTQDWDKNGRHNKQGGRDHELDVIGRSV